jgi:hypothetical protein
MSLYDQTLLADTTTDNYSTIAAFEEQENQTKTLQGNDYLSNYNVTDSSVIIGGGGSILAIGVVVLAFLSARSKRDALIRVITVLMTFPVIAMGYYFIAVLPENMKADTVGAMLATKNVVDFVIHDPTFIAIGVVSIIIFVASGVLGYFISRLYPDED